jgi:hypothetical protein
MDGRETSAMPARLKPHPIPDPALDADIAILGKKGRRRTAPTRPPKRI